MKSKIKTMAKKSIDGKKSTNLRFDESPTSEEKKPPREMCPFTVHSSRVQRIIHFYLL